MLHLKRFPARLTGSRGLILVILARLLANELQKGGRKREASQESRAKRNLFEDGQGRRCFIVIASWLVLGNVRRNLKKNSQSITSDRQSASRYKLLSKTRHRRRRQIARRYLFPLLSTLGLFPRKKAGSAPKVLIQCHHDIIKIHESACLRRDNICKITHTHRFSLFAAVRCTKMQIRRLY